MLTPKLIDDLAEQAGFSKFHRVQLAALLWSFAMALLRHYKVDVNKGQ